MTKANPNNIMVGDRVKNILQPYLDYRIVTAISPDGRKVMLRGPSGKSIGPFSSAGYEPAPLIEVTP